jgi:outer membrane lipoprotein LolB
LTRAGWRRAILTGILSCLAACATVDKGRQEPEGESISGRLSVRVEATTTATARSVSAGFDLHGGPSAGRLNLSSPLGTVLAQARWSPGRAVLTTSEGTKDFADMDALTLEMLGESLPVAALFDWLHGRPWPQAPSQAASPPDTAGFRQLGWSVDTSRFGEGWVEARRAQAPQVTIRARVEQP